MRKNLRTYLILLGLVIAFLLFYTSSFSNVQAPKFTYSLKSAGQTITNEFTSQVGASMVKAIKTTN
ncbi:hypothetical protein [Marinoscillum sp.]|uniref:hypothetical protein n=1 Tax=Marinoscillum sp. TaxID=2024838 RepID=UPI003BAC1458